MNIHLNPDQTKFINAEDRIYCQWFERGEGATLSIVYDSLLKSFKPNEGVYSGVYVFSDEVKTLSKCYEGFTKLERVPIHIKENRGTGGYLITNRQTGNLIELLPKSRLKDLRFCANERFNYVYVDDYCFDLDKYEYRWTYLKSLKQLKICGKY